MFCTLAVMKKPVLLLFILSSALTHFAQPSTFFKPKVTRILFLLDASGSMKEKWEDKSRFESARDMLYKLTDSVGRVNPNVEFGLRVFGHQSPRNETNCKDSKLEIPFAKKNAEAIRQLLQNIAPQGQTPIAYSLEMGAQDFPRDQQALNVMILITDGEESCQGDPCRISQALTENRVALKPFIVGMASSESLTKNYECVGSYLDTRTEAALTQTVGLIIRQTLNTTTTQINLLDAGKNPTITNIPFTLYDHYSGKVLYNFIHTLDARGVPDTLFLDPVGVYDLEIHSVPPIRKEGIEITPGRHNIIALDVPVASFMASTVTYLSQPLPSIIRQPGSSFPLASPPVNQPAQVLADPYQLDVLSSPRLHSDTVLHPGNQHQLNVPLPGTVTISFSGNDPVLYCILQTDIEGETSLVERHLSRSSSATHSLLPGRYTIVGRGSSRTNTESSRSKNIDIFSNRNTLLTW